MNFYNKVPFALAMVFVFFGIYFMTWKNSVDRWGFPISTRHPGYGWCCFWAALIAIIIGAFML